ncbi:MAG TPA: type II secretion system F family protein [Stellaceae bacterium]|jgi:tight adherence protein C
MSVADLLSAALDAVDATVLVEAGAGVGCFLSLVALARTAFPGDPTAARARTHAKRRAELRAGLLTTARRGSRGGGSGADGARPTVGLFRRVLEWLKLTRSEEARKTAEMLARAGWRSADTVTLFLGLRLCLPVLVGSAAYLGIALLGPDIDPMRRLLGAVFGALVGAYGPTLFVRNAIQRRRQKLLKGLPDALDLLVICAEAGLSLDAALTRVAREIGPAAPELADEIGLTAIELGFLPNRRDALHNLNRRTELPAIRGVVNTLVQTERYGTPLAHSLRVLAAEFRDARMMRAEEKAARLPATLTVPMIIFILPVLFIVLVGPAIIQAMQVFRH